MWATWEGFLFSLQEASDFVEMHKPQVSEKLLETISVSMFWAHFGQFIIALLTTMAFHYLLITKCCTPNSFFFQTQALEQSAEEIGKTATSGRFLDPNENPKSIVQSIREVRGVIARKLV